MFHIIVVFFDVFRTHRWDSIGQVASIAPVTWQAFLSALSECGNRGRPNLQQHALNAMETKARPLPYETNAGSHGKFQLFQEIRMMAMMAFIL